MGDKLITGGEAHTAGGRRCTDNVWCNCAAAYAAAPGNSSVRWVVCKLLAGPRPARDVMCTELLTTNSSMTAVKEIQRSHFIWTTVTKNNCLGWFG